jgi:hypothetical protein
MGQFPRLLVQTMLPYQTPRYPEGHPCAGSLLPTWTHTNGAITLRIESGYHPATNRLLGIPGGGTARLLMGHIASEVVVKRNRCVHLGETISGLLRTLGLHEAGDRYQEVRDQLLRLAFARISHIDRRRDPGWKTQFAVKQSLVADEIRFWETECDQAAAERSIDDGSLRVVDHKCAYMERCGRSEISVSWRQLHTQFPASYGSAKQFARRVRRALAEIQGIWPMLRYETPRGRLVLKQTRPHVPGQ